MSERIVNVTDADFDAQVLQSGEPVLVDFWAEWCAPCKMIAPLVDDIAESYAGRLKVVKLDIEENKKTPRSFAVRGIPTLILFKDGKPHATQVGAINKAQLTQFIERSL